MVASKKKRTTKPKGSGYVQKRISALGEDRCAEMTIGQIASAVGSGESRVCQIMKEKGWKCQRKKKDNTVIAAIELIGREAVQDLTACELIQKTGYSSASVYHAIKQLGWEMRGPDLTRSSKRDWGGVDWELRDVDIAKLLGCTKQRVSQVRHMLGKPKSRLHRQMVGRNDERNRKVAEAVRKHPEYSDREIGRAAGLSFHTVAAARKDLGIKATRRITPSAYVDWRLVNEDIVSLWKLHYASIPSLRQRRGKLGKPMIPYLKDRQSYYSRMENTRYRAIYEQQKAAAEKFFASGGRRIVRDE